ncbi:type I polyketide synthase [Actinospica robiniae]|uniref:type I polyketide synthase n=1 Tax=Actinospica robiniae TaxID=304901 RepID=UPI00040CAE86|nr:type I polyketide synthase [Actinospica robiniae]
MDTDGRIAVTGMAVRLPGAADLARYWRLLQAGAEGITRHGEAELLAAGYDAQTIRSSEFVPAGGALPAARAFDWSYFGYSRTDAALIDPQQRVFLQCAAEALDDAGIDPTRFAGWIGVYGGSDSPEDGLDDLIDPLLRAIGRNQDFLATRVAYKLGLRGPAFTVQTACSTSLTAVHLAVQSLLSYETDAALAGGVGLASAGRMGYTYVEGGSLSPDGHCRSFDARALGTVPSEGVGMVVLRRLEDALRDGDRIAAVILGSAVNNDAGDKIGFTAPSVSGQREAILLAQKVSGVDPADLGYIEAHGTATPMGDPIEVQALTDAFRRSTDATGYCGLGSVKSNIGHTGAAAGVAGLIKTVLMLEHRELVPSLHFTEPNPRLQLEDSPFRVTTRRTPWPERGTPMAAVSAFGLGGTNAHVILQAPPSRDRPAGRRTARVLGLSAMTGTSLDRMRGNLADHLEEHGETELGDATQTLARRRQYEHRVAVVAAEPGEAAEALRVAAPSPGKRALGKVAFLFPGHGVLDHAAGAAAYRLLPTFRTCFDEMADAFQAGPGVDLAPVVVPGAGDAEWFSPPAHQHAGLLALGYALAKQLIEWRVCPAGMIGNSIGECVAATVAGLWTPAEAAAVVHTRAVAAQNTKPGRMIAVKAPVEEVLRRIAGFDGVGVAVAGPGTAVISGIEAAMDALTLTDALDGLDLTVLDAPAAGHSAAMEPAARELRAALARVTTREPGLPFVSNLTGQWARPEAVLGADYWADQLCRTVQLEAGIATLIDEGCDTFIELGPGTSMCGSLRRHRDWDPERFVLPMLGRAAEDRDRSLLRAIGALWERGAEIDLAAVTGDSRAPVCSLPPYAFDAQDPRADWVLAAPAEKSADSGAPHQDDVAGLPTLELLWRQALGVSSVRAEDDFFALGGESLMAVNLVNQIRRHWGVRVTAAEFLKSPTFATLVRLAGPAAAQARTRAEAATSAASTGLVTLREGTGRPVFFAADVLGTSSSYLVLADLLETDRPVCGLEQTERPGRFPRLERLAAEQVALARQAQPEGPYTLAGWSFGAVLAHEMARQLIEAGQSVDLLVCLDGQVRGRRGRPLGASPAVLRDAVTLQVGVALGTGPLGARIRRLPELRRRFLANAGALLRYRPKPAACRTVLFKAEPGDAGRSAAIERGLASLYREVRVEPVAGDHWSMLAEPHARGLAARISALLPHDTPRPAAATAASTTGD